LASTLYNISHFADRGGGLFAECASIGTYENFLELKYNNGSISSINKQLQNTFPEVPFFHTPPTATGTITYGGNTVTYNGIVANGVNGGFVPNGQDCSDPGATGKCFQYANYDNPFMQIGDYQINTTGGTVRNYHPSGRAVGTMTGGYNGGTLQFVTTNNGKGDGLSGWDVMTFRFKDNNKKKGPIMYLAGHSFNSVAGGNRIVLDTLLNLGYRPRAQEFARSEPVYDAVYLSGSATMERTNYNVLLGTLAYRKPDPVHHEWESLDLVQPEGFWFPYQEGHFRATKLTDIDSVKRQDFFVNLIWDTAEQMPAPAARQIFTVLGTNQAGLVKLPVSLAETTISSCTDNNLPLVGTGTVTGVCDLTEAFSRTNTGVLWADSNNDGVIDSDLVADPDFNPAVKDIKAATGEALAVNAIEHFAKHFVQRLRGYCWSHVANTFTPSVSGDCDNADLGEIDSKLGGIDHASAAVAWESPRIRAAYDGSGGLPNLQNRPVMAYVGGLDGQLHAIYLRKATDPSTGAAAAFPGWTAPAEGTEIWAFLPKGQLSRLRSNDAKVDVSPVVSDVFVDYDWAHAQDPAGGNGTLDSSASRRHTGVFSWRTVLVGGSGRWAAGGLNGGEVFALDVTDPTKPFVLWDLNAYSDNIDSALPSKNTVVKWVEQDGVVPPYLDPPLGSSVVAGVEKTGTYNYADLGASTNLTIVPMQGNNRPYFQVMVTTNSGLGTSGQLNVFAINVGTGEKNWQWQRQYEDDTGNSVPPSLTNLDIDGDGYIDRSYVGDMEGSLWELDASDGSNLNYFCTVNNPCFDGGADWKSYRLFRSPAINTVAGDTIPRTLHPISSTAAITRIPYDPGTVQGTSILDKLQGRTGSLGGKLAMVFGTAGRDWVLAQDATVQGRLYIMPFFTEEARIRQHSTNARSVKLAAGEDATLTQYGALKQIPASESAVEFVELSPGERIEGTPTIVGMDVYVSTAFGSTESNIFSEPRGNTLKLGLATAGGPTTINDVGKSAAGPVIIGTDLVTASTSGIQRTDAVGTQTKARRSPVRIKSFIELGRKKPW